MPGGPSMPGSGYPSWQQCADFAHCYVLFPDVACNIRRWGSDDEPTSWNYARGLLVEHARYLVAEPLALHYRELETPAPGRLPIGVELTAVLRTRTGGPITVVSRHETAPFGARGDYWRLTVNGTEPTDGRADHPPSLPRIAQLTYRHLNNTTHNPAEEATPPHPGGSRNATDGESP